MTRLSVARGPAGGHLAELALLALLATLWGLSYTFIKVSVETIPPPTLVAARTVIAAVLLIGALRLRGVAMPTDLAMWRRFLAQACLNSVLPFTLIAWAEQTVDASVAAILNAATPVAAFVLALPCARAKRAMGPCLLGVACGMAGVVLIVGVQALGAAGDRLMAELAIVAATF